MQTTLRGYQDYARIIPANSVITLKATGEFAFLKAADRPVYVTVGNSTIKMESGAKMRPERSFDELQIENRTSAPLAVLFTIGYGDYEDQIIRGEVSVVPGVRDEAGRFQTDTRQTRRLFVRPDYEASSLVSQGDAEKLLNLGDVLPWADASNVDGQAFTWTGSELLVIAEAGGGETHIVVFDENLNLARDVPLSEFAPDIAYSAGYVYLPRTGGDVVRRQLAALEDGQTETVADWEVFFDGADWPAGVSRADAIGFSPDGAKWYAWYNSDDVLREYDTASNTLTGRTLNNVFFNGFTVAQSGEIVHVTNSDYRRVSMDGTVTEQFALNIGGAYGAAIALEINGVGYLLADGYPSSDPAAFWRVRVAPDDATDVLTGTALEGGDSCLCLGALLKREIRHMVASDAALAFNRSNGEWGVRGEVIKLALQLAGETVPGDYLDHVYGIEADGVRFYSGPQSFAAAGIADDFKTTLPGVVTLTVDTTLANR